MLKSLTVSNLAIVEKAEVVLTSGLTVLTGETGAGKSVLIGALELVLGGRAEQGLLREGAKEARVEAEFELKGASAHEADAILGEAGLPLCEEGRLVVRRSIGATGARAWANDASCSVSTLRRLAQILVDIHGPRANQHILDESFQRSVLDGFGGIAGSSVQTAYSAAWKHLQEIRHARAELERDSDVAGEIDLLTYQTNELESAQLTEADDDLAARHAAAAHAGEILATASDVTEGLGGDEGVADRLGRLQGAFAALARRLPAAVTWQQEAEELTVRVQELSRTIADAVGALEVDPGALDELDARLSLVNKLQRKYAANGTVADLREVLVAKRARIDELEGRTARLEQLAHAEGLAREEVARTGAALTKKRQVAAVKLGRAITKELVDLGFLKAAFSVSVSEAEPAASGCDQVSFLFEPNPGEPARPLAAIASSGEAARVMLAVKVVLAAHDTTDLLVFDEIDANIGGEVGASVGAKLHQTALAHQVIAITHLPQSAAAGDHHLVVTKRVTGGRTCAQVTAVEGEARVRELARMLGGAPHDAVVWAHAEELVRKGAKL